MSRFSEMGYKVGDLFIITSEQEACVSAFSEGDLVEFTRDDGSMCPQFTRVSDGQTGYEQMECLIPYVKVGDVASEPVPQLTPEYQVGDTVEIIDCICGHGFEVGQHVRLCNHHSDRSWRAEDLEGRTFWYIEEDEFKPLSSVSDSPETSCSDDTTTLNENECSGSTSGKTGCNQYVESSVAITTNVSFNVKIKGQEFVLTKDEVSELYIALCSAEGSLQEWSLG